MEISTKIKDGVHMDNNVYDQPDFTMRDSMNGIVTDNGNGYYKWSNIKGNTISFGFASDDKYMSHCLIKDRLFVFTLKPDLVTRSVYGKQYNWYVGIDPRGIMNSDWRVPSFADWDILSTFLGGNLVAGGKLKEIGLTHWDTPNTDATNEVGFNALGGGNRYIDVPGGDGFASQKIFGDFQCSDEVDDDTGVSVFVEYDSGELHTGFFNKICGMNIRGIKNSTSLSHGDTGTYVGNDGKVYGTICIGAQEWMSENLAETMYNNGELVPEVTDDAIWQAMTSGAFCYYENLSGDVTTPGTVKLWEVILVNNLGTLILKWTASNTDINLSFEWPIRTMIGFYENEEIQRIYWNDFHNQSRVINVKSIVTYPGLVTVDNKFIEFYPIINKVYGSLAHSDLSVGGSCKAGTLFFVWRYYTIDGYFSDWSHLSNPIAVVGGTPGSTLDNYQEYQGDAPDHNTQQKVTITISDIDTDYDNIQVCVFYSNDYNISVPGEIFYDGAITHDHMDFIYHGSANLGTVTLDDLILSTVRINAIKENTIAKKQNVIACITERPDLTNVGSKISVDATVQLKGLPLDFAGYPGKMTSPVDSKALFGLINSATDETSHTLRGGQYYKAVTDVSWNDGTGIQNELIGDVFFVSINDTPTWISGTFKCILVKRKYLLAGGVSGGDVNTNYRWEEEDLDGEFYDWKSQKVCKWHKSYPHGETIRLGILFFDKTGRPYYVRRLTNINTSDGDVLIPLRSPANPMLTLADWVTVGTHGYWQTTSARLQYIKISGLDLTDILASNPDIGGFSIVRCPIVHQYLGMGLISPTRLATNDVYCYPGYFNLSNYANNYFTCYDFICPEDLFELKGFALQPGDELENTVYLTPYVKNEVTNFAGDNYYGFGRQESSDNIDFYQKFLIEGVPAAFICQNGVMVGSAVGESSHSISSVVKFELSDTDLPINPIDPTKLYQEGSYPNLFSKYGYVNNHSVLILDIDDDVTNIKGPSYTNCNQATGPMALLCSIKRANVQPYGSDSDSALSNNIYVSTGHFQEINPTVLADVLIGGRYIFNDIDIFGGDTFVQLFDYKRLYCNIDVADAKLGHGIIFPVESRINIGLREGDHLAKTRSYDSVNNTDGLKLMVGSTKLEEYNYNDGYSSDDIGDHYLALPYNFQNVSEAFTRIRYSLEKNYGEIRDNFRVFLANDYIDLDPNKGPVSNIRYKSNRLIYWQPDEIGYIPLQERALTQNSVGQPVQLGIGGLFERYDQLVDRLGNSHQFGLIESPLGYHWYDSRRKLYISINFGLQISKDSIIKGMDRFFKDNIIDNLDLYDNPFASSPGGLFGGYDPQSKMAFTTFLTPVNRIVTRYTIGLNTVLNKFTGKYGFYPSAYFTVKNHLFHVSLDQLNAYLHGAGPYCTFFESFNEAYVTIIVKEDTNTTKIFDTFELIGSTNFFTSILFENSGQSIEEVTATYPAGVLTIQNRNYEFLKHRWFGNFPKVTRERMNDGYMKITFKMASPYAVELFEMKSNVRKIY